MIPSELRQPASIDKWQKLVHPLDRNEHATRAGATACVAWFIHRSILKVKHAPEQLFDVLVTPVIFVVMFTYLFGGAIAGSSTQYLQYLLPGILAQAVIFTAHYPGVTLNGDIGKGVYDRYKSMPIWSPAPIIGIMLGDILRYSCSSLVVIAVGFAMGYKCEAGWIGVVWSMLLLNAFAFGIGWIFVILGLCIRTPGSVVAISMLIVMPLSFASNVFVDPSTMPTWLETLVLLNPVSHLVSALRGLLNSEASLSQILIALATPATLTVALGPLAMRLYQHK